MSEVKILTFHKARVDVPRDGRAGQSFGHLRFRAKDHARRDVYDAPFPTSLDDLGVQQLGWRNTRGVSWPPSFSGARYFLLNAVGFQQRIIVVFQFIAGKQRYMTVTAILRVLYQKIRIFLRMAAYHEVNHDLVDRIKTDPYPLIAIDAGQLL